MQEFVSCECLSTLEGVLFSFFNSSAAHATYYIDITKQTPWFKHKDGFYAHTRPLIYTYIIYTLKLPYSSSSSLPSSSPS